MKYGLIGAFDRYNYGDVLFPLIATEIIQEHDNKAEIEYLSITSQDLTSVGGFKTRNLSSVQFGEFDHLLIVGGETATACWHKLYLQSLSNSALVFMWRVIFKFISFNLAENITKRILKGKSYYPYDLTEKEYGSKVSFISIGGTNIIKQSENARKELKNIFASANHVSVRDSKTLSDMKEIGVNNAIQIPDAAFLISDLIPIETAIKNTTPINSKLFESMGKYIAFQIGYFLAKDNYDTIIEQLRLILKHDQEIKILLLPIGRASLHDDIIALKRIEDALASDRVKLVENSTISEVVLFLSHCYMYFGTSLHGAITTLTYGNPCITMDSRILKTKYILNDYFSEYEFQIDSYDQIYDMYNKYSDEKIHAESKIYIQSVVRNLKNQIRDTYTKVIVDAKERK